MSEINEKEIKRRFEAISNFEAGPEVTARNLERVRQMLTKLPSVQETRPQNIWRIIMRTKIIKFAAAAVIIIAALIGINSFLGTGTSVAFAEVLEYFQAYSYGFDLTGEDGSQKANIIQGMVWEVAKCGWISQRLG